jgi:hypothetical protein
MDLQKPQQKLTQDFWLPTARKDIIFIGYPSDHTPSEPSCFL